MANPKEIEVFKLLVGNNCCERCALRFCFKDFREVHYDNLECALIELGVAEFNSNRFGNKETKPCSVCLGILQDDFLDLCLSHPQLKTAEMLDFDDFDVHFISLPCITIREHSLKIFLKERNLLLNDNLFIPSVTKIWKHSIKNRLGQAINKILLINSELTLTFTCDYDLNEIEAMVMCQLDKNIVRNKQFLNKMKVISKLQKIDDFLFKQHVTVPPKIPMGTISMSNFSYNVRTIILGGSFCKYSRNMNIFPYKYEETVIVKHCIQEIIFESIKEVLECDLNMIFKTTKENKNYRILGHGKLFIIEISDCPFSSVRITYDKLRSIENSVKKSKLAQIKNLQILSKQESDIIRSQDAFKTGYFHILCLAENRFCDLKTGIKKLNECLPFSVEQMTPLDRLHLRQSTKKQRKVYEISAKHIKDNLFQLNLCVESSFYLEEFVNGDLGRSKPSIRDLIGSKVDVLAVDSIGFFSSLSNI